MLEMILTGMVGLIVGAIGGFIAGLLVYRHNMESFLQREAELIAKFDMYHKMLDDKIRELREKGKEILS